MPTGFATEKKKVSRKCKSTHTQKALLTNPESQKQLKRNDSAQLTSWPFLPPPQTRMSEGHGDELAYLAALWKVQHPASAGPRRGA
jgi:hypothetical protein